MELKLTQDSSIGETNLWMDRLWKDCGSHSLFANIVRKVQLKALFLGVFSPDIYVFEQRFVSAVAGLEVGPLGQLCQILHRSHNALDMVALDKSITDLLFYSIQFLEDYDCARLSASFSTSSVSSWADDQDR